MTKKARQVCPECTSDDLMERKGVLNKHHDHVCLKCGYVIKDTGIEVYGLDLVPMKENKEGGKEMKNGWYLRKKLGNKNVPSGVNVTGSLVKRNVIDTYYNVKGRFYRVGSLPYELPQEIKGHRAYI